MIQFRSKKGFTLIELMIVVAIIGILAAIAIPQFANMVAKSQEGATKGNLGTIRSALSIYYGDTEGVYPVAADGGTTALSLLGLGQKYLKTIPIANAPRTTNNTAAHPKAATSTGVDLGAAVTEGVGNWAYDGVASRPNWGHVVVHCIHGDVRGQIWTSF